VDVRQVDRFTLLREQARSHIEPRTQSNSVNCGSGLARVSELSVAAAFSHPLYHPVSLYPRPFLDSLPSPA